MKNTLLFIRVLFVGICLVAASLGYLLVSNLAQAKTAEIASIANNQSLETNYTTINQIITEDLETLQQVKKMYIETKDGNFLRVDDQWIDANYFRAGITKDQYGSLVMGGRPQKVVTWTDGVLPIQFRDDVKDELRKMVWSACAEWASAANVKCIKGKYKGAALTIGRNFMGVKKGCWSMLGSDTYFAGLRRRMNLGPGCDKYEIVLHELGHSLGLTHEHQRSDRDDYVHIAEENVDKEFMGFGMKLNFEKQPTQNFTPYDFFSIMHYSRRAGSINGKDTIIPLEQFKDVGDKMGRVRTLSDEDRAAIAALYGPRK